jgi:ATP synthase F0 subunit c
LENAMKKAFYLFLLMMALTPTVAMAQAANGTNASQGYGLMVGGAVEAIARQPEATGQISTAMINTAALIEGVALFAIVVALLISFKTY